MIRTRYRGYTLKELESKIDANPRRVIVTAFDVEAVFVGIAIVSCLDDEAAYISDVFVDPNHRRRGLATMLVNACERIAREQPTIKTVALTAIRRNGGAKALYVSLGYVSVSDEPTEQLLAKTLK